MVSTRRFAGSLALVLACVMMACALVLSACGSAEPSSSSSSSSAVPDDPYGLVVPGTLTVVTYAENPPMEYEEGNSVTGFDIALITEIANRLDLAIDIEDEPFDLLLGEVANGGICDCAISAIEINELRARNVLFSEPYLDASVAVIVSSTSKVTSVAELSKPRVGAIVGSPAEAWAKANLPVASFTPFREVSDLLGALEAGTIDVAAYDGVKAAYAIDDDKLKCKVIANVPTGGRYGIAVNVDNPTLVEAIDVVLTEMDADGTMAKLRTRWLGEKSE